MATPVPHTREMGCHPQGQVPGPRWGALCPPFGAHTGALGAACGCALQSRAWAGLRPVTGTGTRTRTGRVGASWRAGASTCVPRRRVWTRVSAFVALSSRLNDACSFCRLRPEAPGPHRGPVCERRVDLRDVCTATGLIRTLTGFSVPEGTSRQTAPTCPGKCVPLWDL